MFNYAQARRSANLEGRSFRVSRRIARKRDQRGATMVEFALFFLLFLTLTVGLMELGRGIWTFTTLSHAARQGARYAIVHGSQYPLGDGDTSIEDVVRANAVGLDPANIAVTATYDTTNEAGEVIQVRAQYPFQLVVSPLILGQDTITLGSTSRMVIAN